jgi:hypothetical protein
MVGTYQIIHRRARSTRVNPLSSVFYTTNAQKIVIWVASCPFPARLDPPCNLHYCFYFSSFTAVGCSKTYPHRQVESESVPASATKIKAGMAKCGSHVLPAAVSSVGRLE